MAELRIRITAVADSNVAVAYRPVVEAAERARRATEDAARRAGATQAKETRKGTDAAEKAYAKLSRDAERWRRQMVRDAERAAKGEQTAAERSAAEQRRAHEKAEREKTRATEREAAARARAQAKQERDVERNSLRARSQTLRESNATRARVAGAVTAIGGRALRQAGSFMSDVARGVGVDVGISSMVRDNTALENKATQLSNQGLIAGDERNGARVDPRQLMSQAFAVGTKTGTSAEAMLEGMEKFTSKTGDLQTARDILEQMAIYSKATGASLEDMMDASGDLANALGDVDSKGEKVASVMRSIIGGGKLGAVEIKDFATQMAKIGAAAGTFEGGAKAVVQMGVLAQEARAKGGSASATQAATSVASFANTFSKAARLEAFEAQGIKVHNAQGLVRDPRALIIEAIAAAGRSGNFDRTMGSMFMDVRARSATRGFEKVYKEAGGGDEGIRAVEQEFDRLARATVAEAEVAESFARAMQTTESKTTQFNVAMRETAAKMQEDLMPAMISLAPAVVDATRELGKFVEWLTGDRQLDTELGNAKRDVGDALASTDKQLAGGMISSAQLKANKVAESEAFEAMKRANAEKDLKAGSEEWSPTTKAAMHAADALSPVAIVQYLRGEQGGGAAAVAKNERTSRDADEARAKKAEEASALFDKIHESNQRVERAVLGLGSRTLTVKVVNNPVRADGKGRQPEPEDKPR